MQCQGQCQFRCLLGSFVRERRRRTIIIINNKPATVNRSSTRLSSMSRDETRSITWPTDVNFTAFYIMNISATLGSSRRKVNTYRHEVEEHLPDSVCIAHYGSQRSRINRTYEFNCLTLSGICHHRENLFETNQNKSKQHIDFTNLFHD